MRNLNPAYEIIKKFEGLYLKAYKDPVGIPTIGWGCIRYPTGKPVQMGDVITKEQAQSYLEHEVMGFVKSVESLIKVECNDNQFCALVSFAYNVGADIDADDKAEGLGDSTLLKKLNAKEYLGAADEFLKWNKAGGQVLKGLTRRRTDERELFLTPVLVKEEIKIEEKGEMEFDQDVIETPSWFEPFKQLIIKLFEKLFPSESKGEPGTIPDNPETGGVAQTKLILSEGVGPRISKQRIEEIIKANGGDVSKVNLVCIRGYYLDSMGVKGQNDRGIYDDAAIWYRPESFYTFQGNTDPSRVRKGFGFGASKGMANVKVGRWPKYFPGMHNGSVPHLAFRQGGPITVVRDGNPNYENTGMFGCNVHRGGVNGTSSLGCITIAPKLWTLFKATGDAYLKAAGQKEFDLIMVNETDLRVGKVKA
jgi:lysozyme